MGKVARAIANPISLIIGKDATRILLEVATVVASFVPGGQPYAALFALELAVLYAPKAPKPDSAEAALKVPIPPRVSGYGRSRLYGAYILFETNDSGRAIDVYAIHDGLMDGPEAFYIADQQVATTRGVVAGLADGSYGGSDVEIDYRQGLATETAFSQVTALAPTLWDANHRGDGVVTAMVTWQPVGQKNYTKRYPNGQPPLSIVARWQRVFDWRDNTQSVTSPTTWKWSENAILHTAHYRLVREGRDWTTHFLPTLAYWTAAANDCDVAMTLKAGGTEPRYRSCVAHKHIDTHKAVIGALLACCDGWIAPRADGALMVFSGRYYTPTVSIGSDEIVSYSWTDGIADEDDVNEIVVSYTSGAHAYNTVEASSWRDEDAIAASGEVKSTTFAPQVPSNGQARRLVKRLLSRQRAPYRGTITTNVAGRKVRGQRYINLRIIEAGAVFYDGPAEITALTRNLSTGGVTFSWVAADPDIDAWNPATEEGDPAPVGNRIAPAALTTPTITSATAFLSDNSAAGTAGVRITIVAAGPNRSDLTWFVRRRVTGAAVWNEAQYSDIDPGTSVTLVTDFVPADSSVDVEVAYQVGDGRVSDWTAATVVNTTTAGLGPAAPTSLTATNATGGNATVSWRNPTSANFAYARLYRGSTNVFGSATQIGGNMVGGLGAVQSLSDPAGAGTWYYWVRGFTSAGTSGALTGPVSVTVT